MGVKREQSSANFLENKHDRERKPLDTIDIQCKVNLAGN